MKDTGMAEDNIATIVASYASRQDTTVDDILNLVARLRGQEAQKNQRPSRTDTRAHDGPEPALPLDQAFTRSEVFCLCCGRGFKMLKRHLGAEHGLTEAEYRATFGLPESFPLVAPDYSEKKAAYARQAGLGTHARDVVGREKGLS